jgi:hypothetical protein
VRRLRRQRPRRARRVPARAVGVPFPIGGSDSGRREIWRAFVRRDGLWFLELFEVANHATLRGMRLTHRLVFVLGAVAACSNNSGSAPVQTGSACTTAGACYPALDAAALHGTVTCLTQLQNGYCTHTCTADSDCCAVPGECAAGVKEVCAPLQSAPQTYCFVSCDAANIPASAGTTDPNVYCQKFANASFTCRSTGGGSANKKFCGP